MIPPITPGESQYGQDFLGKSLEQYFQDYVAEFPITIERLDDLLEDFFRQGFSDGYCQGQMQGFEDGCNDKVNEIVQFMLHMGMDIETIIEATGAERDEVLQIQKFVGELGTSAKKAKNKKGGKKGK